MNDNFKGIIPALIVPFDEKGNLKYDTLIEFVHFSLQQGVKGFYTNGSSGEFPTLSIEERIKILEIVKSEVTDKAIIINHVGTTSTEHSKLLAKHSKEVGVDAISSVPPFYYVYSFDEIKKYYSDVTEAGELPMIAYNIPALTGVNFNLENVGELKKIPNMVGIKYTASDFYMMERIKTTHSEMLVYNGPDEMLLAGLSMGADGAIGTTYNCMFQKANKIKEEYQKGNMNAALSLQKELNTVIQVLIKCGVLPGCKYIIKKKFNIDYGYCRAPRKGLTENDKYDLDSILELV